MKEQVFPDKLLLLRGLSVRKRFNPDKLVKLDNLSVEGADFTDVFWMHLRNVAGIGLAVL